MKWLRRIYLNYIFNKEKKLEFKGRYSKRIKLVAKLVFYYERNVCRFVYLYAAYEFKKIHKTKYLFEMFKLKIYDRYLNFFSYLLCATSIKTAMLNFIKFRKEDKERKASPIEITEKGLNLYLKHIY
jgi:hypothetical protein